MPPDTSQALPVERPPYRAALAVAPQHAKGGDDPERILEAVETRALHH